MDKKPRNETDADAGAGGLPMKVWRALDRAYCAFHAAAEGAARRHGLTVGEMDVLDLLRRRGPLAVGELRRRVRVSSGGATYLVSRLEERGLLERRGTPGDRRARVAALTSEGDAVAAAAQPDYAEAVRRATRGLGKKDRRTLLDLLRALDTGAADGEPTTLANPDAQH